MKTKNKVIALFEIAVVLFSVFLVALPVMAIAADQTAQKASTSTITTTSEDDYVLGIYGNANEDDTIDMRDLTYVKLIFFGKKPETELADAKYDGKINPLDFIQIKLIIVGKEKELTLVDTADRIVTVKKPVEKIVVFPGSTLETMRSLKLESEKIVGVIELMTQESLYFPEFRDCSSVGSTRNPDYEEILNLNPDVVFQYASFSISNVEAIQNKLKELDPSIVVIRFDCCMPNSYIDEVRKLGYISDKENEAKELIDFYKNCMERIRDRTARLSEEDKIKVYFEATKSYLTTARGTRWHEDIVAAGGYNIFGDLSGFPNVDPEEVINRNPEIIVRCDKVGGHHYGGGYYLNVGNTAEQKAIWEEIMHRPELQNINAVKNKNVYLISWDILTEARHFVAIAYMAKWFYPELFEDLDPKAMHQEYLTRFQGLDIDLDKTGVFVYPEPS